MKHPFLRLVGGPVAALIILTATTPVGAEDVSSMDLIDRFELWNVCQPIELLVEGLDDDEVKMGLTREAITATVRSRLRAARLYRESSRPPPYLYVNVNVQGIAFSARLELKKMLSDPISGMEGTATTWNKSMTGQSRNADYILSAVSLLTDMFIDEYLHVNEPDCPRSPIDP